MFRGNRLLPMVQVIRNMQSYKCYMCEKQGIVVLYDGSSYCVHCNPPKFKWNKKTLLYERVE